MFIDVQHLHPVLNRFWYCVLGPCKPFSAALESLVIVGLRPFSAGDRRLDQLSLSKEVQAMLSATACHALGTPTVSLVVALKVFVSLGALRLVAPAKSCGSFGAPACGCCPGNPRLLHLRGAGLQNVGEQILECNGIKDAATETNCFGETSI